MAEARLVRCRECGHEWESTADDPRCSDPNDECGRARADVVEETSDSDSGDDTESGTDGTDSTDDGSDSGRSLFFETSDERTGVGDDAPERPTLDDGDDSDEESDDDDGPDAEIPELEPEDVRPFLVTIFGGPPQSGDDDAIPGYMSMNRGEHWEMRDHELDQLSRAYARVGNKYLPYLLSEYTVEGLALLTTVTVVAPRLQEDRRRAEQEAKRQRDTEPNTGNVRSETSGSDDSTTSASTVDGDDSVEDQLDQLTQADGDAGWTAGANV